jgi:hypothetical protein
LPSRGEALLRPYTENSTSGHGNAVPLRGDFGRTAKFRADAKKERGRAKARPYMAGG